MVKKRDKKGGRSSVDMMKCKYCGSLFYDKDIKKYRCFERTEAGGGGNLVVKNLDSSCSLFTETDKPTVAEKDTAEQEEIKGRFIFDEDRIWKEKVFAFSKITDQTAGFGLLLPEESIRRDRKNRIVKKDQINSPVIILSDGRMLPVEISLNEKYKVKYTTIPGKLDRRWSLQSIKRFTDGKEEKKDGFEIFKKIKKNYESQMYFSAGEWYNLHALWDIGTYFFLLFKAFPIMEIRGLPGTAKTKIMKISRMFSFNATKITINPSGPTLFRETNDLRPTKYIDEAEKLFKFERGQLIADDRVELINASYSCDGCVPRMDKIGNRLVCIYYQTYSPTMLASINGLMGATEERAIVHVTIKAGDEDKRGETEPESDTPEAQKIRDDLYIFALQNWGEIEKEYNNLESANLKKRDFQIWKPILALAKFLNEDLYKNMVAFADKLTTIRKGDGIPEDTFKYRILMIVWNMIQKKEKILVKVIRARMGGEKPPSCKSISSHLDKIGFYEDRQHTKHGSCFNLSQERFESIVNTICPSLFSNYSSSSSSSSSLPIKEERIGDEWVTNKGKGDEKQKALGDESDESDKGEGAPPTGRGSKQLIKTHQDIINFIQNNDQGRGVEVGQLFNNGLGESEVIKALKVLKSKGEIFTPKPDIVKVLS